MKYIVFSVSHRRPGCVLLQSALGGTISNTEFMDLFHENTWLLAPTPDMQAYGATDEQLQQLSQMAQEAVKDEPKL